MILVFSLFNNLFRTVWQIFMNLDRKIQVNRFVYITIMNHSIQIKTLDTHLTFAFSQHSSGKRLHLLQGSTWKLFGP